MNSTDMKYAMQKPCRVYSLPAVMVVLLARCDQSAASSSVITIPRFSSERRHFLFGGSNDGSERERSQEARPMAPAAASHAQGVLPQRVTATYLAVTV